MLCVVWKVKAHTFSLHTSIKPPFQFFPLPGGTGSEAWNLLFSKLVVINRLKQIQALKLPRVEVKELKVFVNFLTSPPDRIRFVVTWEPLVSGRNSHHLSTIESQSIRGGIIQSVVFQRAQHQPSESDNKKELSRISLL